MKLDTYRNVETPEGIALGVSLAGVMPRGMALLLDVLVQAILLSLVFLVLAFAFDAESGMSGGLYMLVFFFGDWFYNVFFEVRYGGATPGKRLLGLKVLEDDGTPVGLTAAVVRNFLRVVDFLPFAYGVGLVSALTSPSFRRVGDWAAGTVVVYSRRRSRAFRGNLENRLPPREVDPIPIPVELHAEEREALLEFSRRQERWGHSRAIELSNLLEPLTGMTEQAGLRRLLAYSLRGANGLDQESFERHRRPSWDALDALVQLPRSKNRTFREADLPGLYREVARDLALARERHYSPELLERLNGLVLLGHHALYRKSCSAFAQAFEFLAVGFPRMVRARAKRFAFCILFFCIPFGLLWYAGRDHSEWIFALLSEETIASLDAMYQSPAGIEERTSELGFFAFAFYIRNNVGINFRVFAGGIGAGVLSLLVLAYNALILGASFGYIVHAGYEEQFLPFVAGHSALEVTGIWLSALAGLEIGFAWLFPGQRTRRWALLLGAKSGLLLLAGAASMTALAALVEGFWSPSSALPRTKYVVGACMWVLVIAYLSLAGRRREA